MMKKAMLWSASDASSKVHCHLCGHRCKIKEGNRGTCGVRINRKGILYTEVYGEIIAQHVDPIEKKPLYHFLPGSLSYSIATIGCNFKCGFCQNWQISQRSKEREIPLFHPRDTPAEEVVQAAVHAGCRSIAYTYTEPTIYFEYAYDIAKMASEAGIANIFVTNGFMTRDAISAIAPYLDGANVDLKSFNEKFYKKICKGKLQPVLDSIKEMHRQGIWVEVTTLLVTEQNTDPEEIRSIAGFIASVSPSIPWHISRYHPDYRFSEGSSPTPLYILEQAYQIGKEEGLHYIYLGNVMQGKDTHCPHCNKVVIKRSSFRGVGSTLDRGSCPHCDTPIAGVWRI